MRTRFLPGAAVSTLFLATHSLLAQGTAFTYQGLLQNNGSPANGTYILTFSLFTNSAGGTAVAGPVTNSAVVVSNGLFKVLLDFGSGVWNGASNWLELAVETNGGSLSTLSPRQQVTPAPYAITAGNLDGTVSSSGLSGTYGNQLTLNNPANQFTGTFSGNGGSLTSLNASQLLSGQVPSAALANAWKTAGNSGTSPSGNFVGTTDNQPLELHVNGQRALRLEPNSSGPNVLAGAQANVIVAGVGAATIGGGISNTIQANAFYSTIGGGNSNTIQFNAGYTTIGGGFRNTIQTNDGASTIGGGFDNTIQTNGGASTIAGGYGNSIQANAYYSLIGGGIGNSIQTNAAYSTIGGGNDNTIQGLGYAVVGGGVANTASGEESTVGGGYGNTASGETATVPGGFGNIAAGLDSFAAGGNAQALHDNSFVWSDGTGTSFSSTTTNQFAVSAAGGVLLAADVQLSGGAAYHNLSLSGGNALGYLYGSYYGLGDGVHLGYNYYWDAGGVGHVFNGGGGTSRISVGYGAIALAVGGLASQPPTNVMLYVSASGVCTPSGTITVCSDRNAKEEFAPVSPAEILDKVSRLPVSEWSYKTDARTRHVGPVAQDFYSAFNLGMDDKHIAPMDESGVALAAIQGLNQKLESVVKEKDAKIRELENRLEKLERVLNSRSGGAL
jgi:hypothetical protein